MDSLARGHAPLCRTNGGGGMNISNQRGLGTRLNPYYQSTPHQPMVQSMSHPVSTSNGYVVTTITSTQQVNYGNGGATGSATGQVLLQGPPPGLAPVQGKEFDSCYSSCDDISHPSLSRESSDPSKIDDDHQTSMIKYPAPEVVEFAIKLGYSTEQLSVVLNRIGVDAKMDDVLSELVKLGIPTPSEQIMTTSQPSSSSSSNTPPNHHRVVGPSSSIPSSSHFQSDTSEASAALYAQLYPQYKPDANLRTVVIDGSNVAMLHGRKEVFSCAGLRECLHYFLERGHPEVLIFIPQYRREQPRSDSPITDQHILQEIERHIIYTPSRNVNGRRVVCHDDRYILRTAELKDAVIVSNDEYRDLTRENSGWRKIVEERLLMFTFVEDKFMPPDDPSGRHGPRIESFLSKIPVVSSNPLICPYARKCTYGNKCKFYHPERANGQHMSVTERLMKENQQKKSLGAVKSMQYEMFKNKHAALSRTQSLNVVKPLTENISQLPPTPESPIHMTRQHMQLQQANSAPWQQHSVVQRHGSSPLTPVNRQMNVYPEMYNQQHQNQILPHQHGVIGSQRPPKMTATVSQTHLFAPSTAVWGHSELSVGPVNTGSDVNETLSETRARVHFHLCHIFPHDFVESVMAANPEEVNAPALCELIIRAQKDYRK
ncbi:hypothetical protein CAEBREN_15437 [Caenorhabditis brenneri]|uniref:C3H1-type domain-containing protein n=1 Tax=Caenorhabditis brenneri TaxID=135651 RepID=G0MNE7_CAEBE|nr:hypothetical protein CAEBREN_15437 [Caenorhabditis brenneri]